MSVYHLNKISSLGPMEKTIKNTLTFEGIALHSGLMVSMTLMPGAPKSGIVFERIDVSPQAVIQARYDSVVARPFCTVIENQDGISVSTIEHLMAALFALGIDNLKILISGPEVPVMDGSSLPFITVLEEAGVMEQSVPRAMLMVLKPVKVKSPWGFVELAPLPSFTIEFEATFESRKAMTPQKRTYRFFEDCFKTDIAPARTFGFFEDIEALQTAGFAKGGSLENAVVVKDGQVLNPEGLRFPDECVRHKILDAMGDLYLAGMPILGKYTARNGGHGLNNQLLRVLLADTTAYRLETFQPENENRWQPLTRSVVAGFTTSVLF